MPQQNALCQNNLHAWEPTVIPGYLQCSRSGCRAIKRGDQEDIDPSPNPCVDIYGLGPEGKQCKACSHMFSKRYDKVYWKCSLRKNTNGAGSDHRKSWPACAKFEPLEVKEVD